MNIFSKIRLPKLGKNNFDLSFENKLTCQMGELIPIVCQEVVPGDQFKMSSNILVRFNPMIAPLMHRVDVYTHFFFVPNRLVWDEWEDFITGGEDGLAQPEKPYMTYRELLLRSTEDSSNLIGPNSLLDYMGVPCSIDPKKSPFGGGRPLNTFSRGSLNSILDNYDWVDTKFDVLPFRAYQLIFNEYYRNQNTDSERYVYKGSGLEPEADPNTGWTNTTFIKAWRNWGLDYFTSALPFSQRGPEQLVPVTGTTPVQWFPNAQDRVRRLDGQAITGNLIGPTGQLDGLQANLYTVNSADGSVNSTGVPEVVSIDNSQNLSVSYDDASITIRDLRRAERLQEWLERSARSGARYIEQIKGHFGVFSSDSRLQRPEYLGGGKQPVQISSVDQTSATNINGSDSPLGSPSGKGISGGTTNSFKTKEMEEHGWIIGIMSVLPKGGYHQGLNRKFSRFDKLDYFWPEFQNIGDQQIQTKELFCGQVPSGDFYNNNPEVGFGYTPRYSEYKSNTDEVHGDFKTTLDFWHLNRKFDQIPVLNRDFSRTGNNSTSNIRQDIFAVQTDSEGNNIPNLYVDIYNNIKARRPMYYYENPDL